MNKKGVIAFVTVFFAFILDDVVKLLFTGFRIAENYKIFVDYIAIAFLLLLFSIYIRDKKEIILAWGSAFFAGVFSILVKFVFQRPRPFFVKYYFADVINYSLPSSHAAVAFGVLPIVWDTKFRYPWLVFAVLVAGSRLVFHEHYLSDVVVGALLGISVGVLLKKVLKKRFL